MRNPTQAQRMVSPGPKHIKEIGDMEALSDCGKTRSPTRGRRKYVLLGLLGLFALVLWLTMKSRQMLAPNPPLVVDEEHLSFGETWEASAFSWTLPIHNTSDDDIDVAEFAVNCVCARIDPPSL